MEEISWDDFEKVQLRVGTILEVLDFPEAPKPAYKVKADFGEFGTRWSSAQITKHYKKVRTDWQTDCWCNKLPEETNRKIYVRIPGYRIYL